MPKKKIAPDYTPMPHQGREITINLWAAFGIVATAVLTGGVSVAFGLVTTANSDHFLLERTVSAVEEIKSDYVREDVFGEVIKRLDRIERKLDERN